MFTKTKPVSAGQPMSVDWDKFASQTPTAPQERWCCCCGEFWTSRTGCQGFNKCPHCDRLHTHEEAEEAIGLARQMRAEQVEAARVSALAAKVIAASKATATVAPANALMNMSATADWERWAAMKVDE